MVHHHQQKNSIVNSSSAQGSTAYRRMMLMRRHSSSASEAPVVDTTIVNNYAVAPDERRWSIAAHEVIKQNYHDVSVIILILFKFYCIMLSNQIAK